MSFLAGIVLYNPEPNRLRKNLEAIACQVDLIVVVNNGISNSEQEVRAILSDMMVKVIDNKENLGIASALNQIIEYAEGACFDWIVTLDQDSIVPPNMISEYEKIIGEYGNVGIICPYINDVNKGDFQDFSGGIRNVMNEEEVITSGSCINVGYAVEISGFDEKLFIDYVDTDFQKRMLLAKHDILIDSNVVMLHEIGRIKVFRVLGFKITCSNHNATRRYFQVRNRLYFKRKYYGKASLFKEKARLLLGTIKIILLEDNKLNKMQATIKGFEDYKELLGQEIVSRINRRGGKGNGSILQNPSF